MAVLLLTVLSRIPFLFNGYGADQDAWRVANVAERLWTKGAYEPSRLPGYPLFEIVSAPLVGLGGPPLANGATLLATLVMLLSWARLIKRHAKERRLLLLSLAFAPMIWQHSAETMDYVWSLLFIILSLEFVLQKRHALGGACLGAAAGFRPPNFGMIIPLAALLIADNRSRREVLIFTGAAFSVTLLAFTPLLVKYGPIGWAAATHLEMHDVHPGPTERLSGFLYRGLYSIGPLAATVFLSLLFLQRKAIRTAVQLREPLVVSALLAIAVSLTLFFTLPLDRAYLMPILPFLLLLVDRFAPKPLFVTFTSMFILHAVINIDIIGHTMGQQRLSPNIHAGMVIEEFRLRQQLLDSRRRIPLLRFNAPSIVMTGLTEAFWAQNPLVEPDTSSLATFLSEPVVCARGRRELKMTGFVMKKELDGVAKAGYRLYCIAAVQPWVERVAGYKMAEAGVLVITPEQEQHPSGF